MKMLQTAAVICCCWYPFSEAADCRLLSCRCLYIQKPVLRNLSWFVALALRTVPAARVLLARARWELLPKPSSWAAQLGLSENTWGWLYFPAVMCWGWTHPFLIKASGVSNGKGDRKGREGWVEFLHPVTYCSAKMLNFKRFNNFIGFVRNLIFRKIINPKAQGQWANVVFPELVATWKPEGTDRAGTEMKWLGVFSAIYHFTVSLNQNICWI